MPRCARARRTSRRCRAGAARAARSLARRPGRADAATAPARRRACRAARRVPAAVERGRQRAVRLAGVRRAGDVGEDAAGRERPNAASNSSPCSVVSSATSAGGLRHRASGRRRSAPRPVHGASSRMRSNPPGAPSASRSSSRPSPTCTSTSSGTRRAAERTSSARAGTISFATSTAPRRVPPRRARAVLPPGAAQRSSQRSPARTGIGTAERERRELRALVLHADAPAGRLGAAIGSPRERADRREAIGLGRRSSGRSGRGPAARRGSRRGDALSAASSSRSSSRAPRRSRACRSARTIQSGWLSSARGARPPCGALGHEPAPGSGEDREIVRSTALANPAALGRPDARAPPARRRRRAVGTRVGEQLVRAESEHVEHGRVDGVGGPIRGERDDAVVVALHAQRAVRELGGEGGIRPGSPARRMRAGSRRFAYASSTRTAASTSNATRRAGRDALGALAGTAALGPAHRATACARAVRATSRLRPSHCLPRGLHGAESRGSCRCRRGGGRPDSSSVPAASGDASAASTSSSTLRRWPSTRSTRPARGSRP